MNQNHRVWQSYTQIEPSIYCRMEEVAFSNFLKLYKFDLMFSKRAFVRWYVGAGTEEGKTISIFTLVNRLSNKTVILSLIIAIVNRDSGNLIPEVKDYSFLRKKC